MSKGMRLAGARPGDDKKMASLMFNSFLLGGV